MGTATKKHSPEESYQGFEQGPIRPPSEASSLLLRVMRNCSWNRCRFCPVYKGTEFSRRPLEHVLKDIDLIYSCVQSLESNKPPKAMAAADSRAVPTDRRAWRAARSWVRHGRKSVFLQDANALILPPADLIKILHHLKDRFPGIERITCYARSSTAARLADEDLEAIRRAGLNRVHIGLESGSDQVLKMTQKGTTQERQIIAGLKIKQAGMELSEYYIPGLGGRKLWELNATETAKALNRINPDFIRIRTLAIPDDTPLADDYLAGRFEKSTDVMMAQELLLFLESLQGITSTVKNDHILNLLPEVEGKLPRDRELLLGVVRAFLALEPQSQHLYKVGRRLGIFSRLSDLEDWDRVSQVEDFCCRRGITSENAEEIITDLMRRFI